MSTFPGLTLRSSRLRRWSAVLAPAMGIVLTAAGATQSTPPPTSQNVPAHQAPSDIVLGMSTALSGTAAGLGTDMRIGVEAALAEANRAGGMRGRTMRLVALDDGYEPSRTAPNMKRLIETDHVLAIVGNVGTPTAVVAMPIASQSGTAFFGAFTGAGVLRRTPPDRCVINYRASYAEETAAMVSALVDHAAIDPDEIGFFTQRDAYGDSGFSGGVNALRARGLLIQAAIPHGRYDRNTDNVEEAVAEILAAPKPPKAIIMVGTAKPSAKFVRLARQSGLNARMLSVSFVGASQLAALLGKDAEGVVVARVVPPQNADLPIIREFRAAVADDSARTSEVALEGYIVGRIICHAIANITGEPTREGVIEALDNLGTFDIGLGAPLTLSKSNHQACTRVWATRLHSGSVESIEWSALKPVTVTTVVPEVSR